MDCSGAVNTQSSVLVNKKALETLLYDARQYRLVQVALGIKATAETKLDVCLSRHAVHLALNDDYNAMVVAAMRDVVAQWVQVPYCARREGPLSDALNKLEYCLTKMESTWSSEL